MKNCCLCLVVLSALAVGLVGCEFLLPIAANSQPLDLYGKVVDQNGDPVSDAKVRGHVLLAYGYTSANQDYYTETDHRGRFKFVDLHGVSLFATPEKPGYEYDSRLPTNWSKNYKPDPDHPMIFNMWKLRGPEPMLHAKFDSRVPYDGTSVTFGLLNGKKGDTGDLEVTLLRNPQRIIRGQERYDWNLQIAVIGGGLSEATGLYYNLAPEMGYESIFTFVLTKDDAHWTPELARTFYIHTRTGTYGRVTIDLVTYSERPDTGITIEAYINPNGSRNLEFDSTKQVKPQ